MEKYIMRQRGEKHQEISNAMSEIIEKYSQKKEDKEILQTIIDYQEKLNLLIGRINLLFETKDHLSIHCFDINKIGHPYNGFENLIIYWSYPLTKEAVYDKQAINDYNLVCTLAFTLNIQYCVNSGELTGQVTHKRFEGLFSGYPDSNQKVNVENISFEGFSQYTVAHIVKCIREVYETRNNLNELEMIGISEVTKLNF
jgi:hypothetical protein